MTKLDAEPTADDVEKAFDGLRSRLTSDEVVFCGFGEPTAALDTLIESARRFKAKGYRTRLNTNGLGSIAAGNGVSATPSPLLRMQNSHALSHLLVRFTYALPSRM